MAKYEEAPPAPHPREVFSGRKSRPGSRRCLTPPCPGVAAPPCLAWARARGGARLGRVMVGDGEGRGPGTEGGTHCSPEPAKLGFQDNQREVGGGTGPVTGL